eukprot:10159966-Alexandrium_andersonii.AAC.1
MRIAWWQGKSKRPAAYAYKACSTPRAQRLYNPPSLRAPHVTLSPECTRAMMHWCVRGLLCGGNGMQDGRTRPREPWSSPT